MVHILSDALWFVVLVTAASYLYLLHLVFGRIRSRAPEVWEELGNPVLFANQNRRNMRLTLNYLRKTRYVDDAIPGLLTLHRLLSFSGRLFLVALAVISVLHWKYGPLG